jgi:nucleotide-binding universal stress UspA family protein
MVDPLVHEPDSRQGEEHRLLSESLAGWTQQYPEVEIKPELVRGRPAAALTERSRTTQLMVTGARGRGGFTGLLLGSVSQTLLHHAGCPVAIVRT